jgi:hypothetical protein
MSFAREPRDFWGCGRAAWSRGNGTPESPSGRLAVMVLLTAATLRFPFTARGRGRKGRGENNQQFLAVCGDTAQPVCRIHPPEFDGGEYEQKRSRFDQRTEMRSGMHGGRYSERRAWRSPCPRLLRQAGKGPKGCPDRSGACKSNDRFLYREMNVRFPPFRPRREMPSAVAWMCVMVPALMAQGLQLRVTSVCVNC